MGKALPFESTIIGLLIDLYVLKTSTPFSFGGVVVVVVVVNVIVVVVLMFVVVVIIGIVVVDVVEIVEVVDVTSGACVVVVHSKSLQGQPVEQFS